MKNVTHHIEVKHDHGFERYLVYTERPDNPPAGLEKLTGEHVKSLRKKYLSINEEIRWYLMGCNFVNDIDDIYYINVSLVYKDPESKRDVHINETNDDLFNIPLNLIYTAACTSDCVQEFEFDSDMTPSLILERRHTQICVNYNSVYMLNMYTDILPLNNVSVRCIEYRHGIMLVRNEKFLSQINNGNLVLAYADIYHCNNDDDVVNITNPSEMIGNIHYDQFTGPVSGNDILVTTNGSLEDLVFKSTDLDSWLVELLTECMEERIKLMGAHNE